jgi:hypothetical protein
MTIFAIRVILKSFVVIRNTCWSLARVVGQASSLSLRNDGQSRETQDRRHQNHCLFSSSLLRIGLRNCVPSSHPPRVMGPNVFVNL